MVSRGAKSNSLQLILTLLVFGALLMPFSAVSAPSAKPAVSLEQGKVILIRKILGHVRWPNDRSLGTLVLGYYGDDPVMYQAIYGSLSNTKIRGKKIRVIQLKKISAVNVMLIPITIANRTAMASGATLLHWITAVSAIETLITIVSRIVMESGEGKQSWTGVVFAVVTAPSAVKTAP